MRDAESISNTTGVVDVLARAAAALAPGGASMIVKLQRHADDVMPGCLHDRSRNRTVDTTGHGDDDALLGTRNSGWRLKIGHLRRQKP
jgi:hypothetical protein